MENANILKKNSDLRLHKWLSGVILNSLLVYSAFAAEPNGRVADVAPKANVTVRISPQDALRQRDRDRLREELAAAKEALKLLEVENETLREEKTAIRRELIEVIGKYQQESGNYRDLKLWLAGIPENRDVRNGRGETPLLEAMSAMRKDGTLLAMKSVEVSEQAWKLIRESSVGKVRQAEFRLKLDELGRLSRQFIAVSGEAEKDRGKFDALRTCRILAVERSLGLAVLSAGSLQGVFSGMTYLSGKDGKQRLKVVSVRPLIAAALVMDGSVESLSPGMEAAAGVTREPEHAGSAENGSKK